jgi:hypothetical protein
MLLGGLGLSMAGTGALKLQAIVGHVQRCLVQASEEERDLFPNYLISNRATARHAGNDIPGN